MKLASKLNSLILVLLVLLLAGALAAHGQIVGGTISGTVREATGASLEGATVTVRQLETGATRELTTGADGRFYAPSVPVGAYSVLVTHDGFAQQQRNGITLTIGQSLWLDIVLGVATVQQEVEVNATDPGVNTTTQQTAGLVDEREVKDLPLNGRSYDELLTLNPATEIGRAHV